MAVCTVQEWHVMTGIYMDMNTDRVRWAKELTSLEEQGLIMPPTPRDELELTKKGQAMIYRVWHIQIPQQNVEFEFPNDEFTLRLHADNKFTRVV